MEGDGAFSRHAGGYFFSPALIVLEDGSHYFGKSFGAPGEAGGEVVFNTSMSGYQEILTDPSYRGQIVVMTYPQIGNYGVRDFDSESSSTFVEGFVIREYTPSAFPARQDDLDGFLKRNNVVSIQDVDTRAIVRRLRRSGSLKGMISSADLDPESLHAKVLGMDGIRELNLVEGCSCRKPYSWKRITATDKDTPLKAVVYDFGAKRGILNSLSEYGVGVTVVPHDFPAEEVLKARPHGVLFSNGPGDPERVVPAIENAKKLVGRLPLFGICLGHQILCLAMGVRIYKLKFGHHGANHPVMNLETSEIEITSQNHGFCIDIDSLKDKNVELTHMNLNDQTLEGFRCKNIPAFCVQYHPEASPGPHYSNYLFDRFAMLMSGH